jgi:hypothetical protein
MYVSDKSISGDGLHVSAYSAVESNLFQLCTSYLDNVTATAPCDRTARLARGDVGSSTAVMMTWGSRWEPSHCCTKLQL